MKKNTSIIALAKEHASLVKSIPLEGKSNG